MMQISVRRTCVRCKREPTNNMGTRTKYCDPCRQIVTRQQNRTRTRRYRRNHA